jgi:hypothetical protein
MLPRHLRDAHILHDEASAPAAAMAARLRRFVSSWSKTSVLKVM